MNTQTISIPLQKPSQAQLPVYSTSLASGADVFAYISEPLVIPAGSSSLIPTGLKVAIPEGFEIQVRPRSGLALKNQITVLNTPGTIDADYRGEIGIILINLGKQDFVVTPGMRIAQLVVCPVFQAAFLEVDSLDTTQRSSGGFGHTGLL